MDADTQPNHHAVPGATDSQPDLVGPFAESLSSKFSLCACVAMYAFSLFPHYVVFPCHSFICYFLLHVGNIVNTYGYMDLCDYI